MTKYMKNISLQESRTALNFRPSVILKVVIPIKVGGSKAG